MGKTVPSYRSALEWEIADWKPFRRSLTNRDEIEVFDQLTDMCRRNPMAAGCACRPMVFEAMVMSIMLNQTKKILELDEQIYVVLAKRAGLRLWKNVQL